VIGLLLVVQVPDASNVGRVAVLLRPLDRFVLRFASGEHVVGMSPSEAVLRPPLFMATDGLIANSVQKTMTVATYSRRSRYHCLTSRDIR
jgi:hypothetical protein